MKKLLLLLVWVPLLGTDLENNADIPDDAPNMSWITGPLLTPVANVVKEGHGKYQPYLYWIAERALFDEDWRPFSIPTFNNVTFQTALAFGLVKSVEFTLIPQVTYQRTEGQQSFRQGDFPLFFGFQVLREGEICPAMKLRLGAILPLGKFQRANPSKLETDLTGQGNWSPNVSISTSKRFHLGKYNWLIAYLYGEYDVATPVRVHGINWYGGSSSTDGTVYPGNSILASAALELTLTKQLGLAIDGQYLHMNKTRYSGSGTSSAFPSADQFSVAPAIEYNFSERLGLITGAWIVLAGRNAPKFTSWVIALNIYR